MMFDKVRSLEEVEMQSHYDKSVVYNEKWSSLMIFG